MYIGDDARREPVHFEGADFNEGGDRPHEAYGESIGRYFLFFDGVSIDFLFWRVYLFILVVEISDDVVYLTLLGLRDLANRLFTLGSKEMNSSLSFLI